MENAVNATRILDRLAALVLCTTFALPIGLLIGSAVVLAWDACGLRHSAGLTCGWLCAGLVLLGGVFVGSQPECR